MKCDIITTADVINIKAKHLLFLMLSNFKNNAKKKKYFVVLYLIYLLSTTIMNVIIEI